MASGLRSKSANIFVYVLLGLLILGLAGFGIGSFSGTVRSIGKVGDTEIPVDIYYRSLQNELSAISAQTGTTVTMAQAQQMGIDRSVLARVVALAALDDEASTLGLSAGDRAVLDEIRQNRAFTGLSGAFEDETYKFVLEQSGLTPAEFEEQTRADLARSIVNTAVTGGLAPSPVYTGTLLNFIAERRSFEWARLGPEALETPVAEPTDTVLSAYYDDNPALFTQPEQRRVAYVWLTPDMLVGEIEIAEDQLRGIYEARIAEFDRPEARLVERLIYGTLEEAQAARARLDAGDTSFEDLVEARGLSLADIDMGDVTADDLAEAASGPVFGLAEPGVVGPVEIDLGAALYRVNAILDGRLTTFEEARDGLYDEAVRDDAAREIEDMVNDIDDLLAGGATLEELAAETAMQVGEVTLPGEDAGGIASYVEFRDAVAGAQVGDYAEIAELSDDGIFAFELLEVIEPRLQPLDEVRETATAGWRVDATRAALLDQASGHITALDTGTLFSELGLDAIAETGLTRDRFVPGAPPALLVTAFELQPGKTGTAEGVDDVYLVRLTEIAPPDDTDQDIEVIRAALDQQYAQGVASDMLDLFARQRSTMAGIDLNQAAINAVHAQIP